MEPYFAAKRADGSPGDVRDRAILLTDLLLLMTIGAGIVARCAAVPLYRSDSGDEWGNTIAPFRVLFEHGDPGTFFHPSLYYDLTAVAYAAIFGGLKLLGIVPARLSMPELFLADERYFVFTARAVSVLAAVFALYAVYQLAATIRDRHAGLLAAALLAVLPLHALYSRTVRVDSVFVLAFVVACWSLVKLIKHPGAAEYNRAGWLIGVAISANYNGALLLLWLVLAHLLRRQPGDHAAGSRDLWRALGLSAVGFLLFSPFVVLNLNGFLRSFGFISSLSVSAHPGWEGRGFFHYVEWLAASEPLLMAVLIIASLAVLFFGSRVERFVLSLPWGYLLIFSLLPTKDERFILPALALFLVAASTLPGCLRRGFPAQPYRSLAAEILAYALLLACVGTMAVRALPFSQPHDMLGRPDGAVFAWLEANVAPKSNILVESGVVLLIDTLKEPGVFAAELRRSLVAQRRNLDQNFIGLVYVGGRNYEPDILTRQHIDYAIISKRHRYYIQRHCDEYLEVCAFYRQLDALAEVVFEPSGGVEPVLVYRVRADVPA